MPTDEVAENRARRFSEYVKVAEEAAGNAGDVCAQRASHDSAAGPQPYVLDVARLASLK